VLTCWFDRLRDDLESAGDGNRGLRDLCLPSAAAGGHPDQPEWLSRVNATAPKAKLAMVIIGISSIRLLATFIRARSMDGETIMWQILLHLTFVVSAVAPAYIDKADPARRQARRNALILGN
jgi:hypothetical protein